MQDTHSRPRLSVTMAGIFGFAQHYAVLVAIFVLFIALSLLSPAFLTLTNILNILNQNAPLAIMASAMTIVIISGGFDLSVGSIFAVTGMAAAALAVSVHPYVGLLAAPVIGAAMGAMNGLIITRLNVHSFLATIATGMVFRSIVLLFSGGLLISVRMPEFAILGRGEIGGVFYAVIIMVVFVLLLTILLNGTSYGRWLTATGGNENAAILAGIKTRNVKIWAFVIAGLAAGLAGAITTSRLSMGQPIAGQGIELLAIAAVILGGTSIYGGEGAIWRSVAGVYLLALINNGFNILNANPFFKDLTTGLIILAAVALVALGKRN